VRPPCLLFLLLHRSAFIHASCLEIVAVWRTADPQVLKARGAELWKDVKEELHHYKLGSKLLWRDMNTSTQLLKRVFSGHTLSRRERQQLLKTSADMFRLVQRRAVWIGCRPVSVKGCQAG
jgi:hypothetical protein